MTERRLRYVAVLAAVALGVAAAGVVVRSAPDDGSAYGYLKLFNEVLALVKSSYVEQVPEGDLMRGAYEGLLAALDGGSEYVTAAEYQSLRTSKSGAEGETGLFLTRHEGILFVAAVLPGTDGQAKGLRLGDQIRRIGDQSSRELSLREAMSALRGPAGSRIRVSISRREEPRREEIEITRRKLGLPSPKLDPPQESVAVVRIPAFGQGSAKVLAGILDRLHKDRIRQAVIDLRGNAWGEIEEAAKAASLFVGEGSLAVLRDRQGSEKPIPATGSKSPWSGETLLLTDAGTAYAAEAFVAALVDKGAAKQAGETTLGLGGEQELLPLGNGDYVSLTVRKLVSPSGKAWHGSGLTPAVSIPADTTVPFKERAERQLHRAVESLREAPALPKAA